MATNISGPHQRRQDQGELRQFSNDLFDCLQAWPDTLFELVDALCTPVTVAGLAHLTLAPGAQRGHGSVYAAIANGEVNAEQVCDVLTAHRPPGWLPNFAVDCSTWPRCDAECSPGRGFSYHPSRHCNGQPIVAGWCYSWLAGLSTTADSWTAPLHARRLRVGENPNTIAVEQIKTVLPRLGSLPATALFTFDGGYDPVQLTVGLADVDAQIVVRIRDNRKFFTPPPPRRPGQAGRSRRHGDRYRLIRVAIPDAELRSFTTEGTYRVVQILLAILVGHPTRSAAIFTAICEADPATDLATVVRADSKDPVRVKLGHLFTVLRDEQPSWNGTAQAFQPWCPRLARHSFHTRDLTAVRLDDHPNPPPSSP